MNAQSSTSRWRSKVPALLAGAVILLGPGAGCSAKMEGRTAAPPPGSARSGQQAAPPRAQTDTIAASGQAAPAAQVAQPMVLATGVNAVQVVNTA